MKSQLTAEQEGRVEGFRRTWRRLSAKAATKVVKQAIEADIAQLEAAPDRTPELEARLRRLKGMLTRG